MKSWILMGAAIGLMHAAAAVAEDDETANIERGEITQLIKQLDSEVFVERETAVAQLTKLGRPAIEALTTAAQDESAETRFRALGVLATLYRSDVASTKEAARSALGTLSKSNNLSIRRAAERLLAAPQYRLPAGIWLGQGSANVFGGERSIVLGGDGGVTINGAGIRIGATGQLILARVNGDERRIDTIKGTGLGVLLLEGRNGIEIHVRQPKETGDPEFTRYVAKDSKELATRHPAVHKVYKALEVYQNNQTIIGGVQIDY